MTTFFLIRHAHTRVVGQALTGRMEGYGLSESGRAQAKGLAARLAAVKLDAIYTSPLERARETAEAIATTRQLPVQTAEGFHEIDFGGWSGHTFEVLGGDALWQQWNQFRSLSSPPEGEMMLLAQARAVRELFLLHRQHRDGTIAVISHADVIKAVVAHLLGVPLDLFGRIDIDPASVSVVQIFDTDVRVRCINHTGDIAI